MLKNEIREENKRTPKVTVTIIRRRFTKEEYYTDYLKKMEVPAGYLSEVMKGEIDYWTPEIPVLLVSGTGNGKTTWFLKDIIPRATKEGRNAIILTSRVSNATQTKESVMKAQDSKFLKRLTPEGVRCQEIYDNVAVVLYQSLDRFLKDPANKPFLEKVSYVIIDEAHYFTNSATYDRKTEDILKLIICSFQQAIRCYMTATDQNITDVIAGYEYKHRSLARKIMSHYRPIWEKEFQMYYYKQKDNFDYCDVRFYKSPFELNSLIQETPDEQWLVFTDSKEMGRQLVDQLGEAQAEYIDADCKNGKTWDLLMEEERFDCHVLVTTTVCDVGINIWSDKLRNVAVAADNPVTLIQEMGRKRRKPGEKIHLWVQELSKRTVSYRYEQCMNLLDWFRQYEEIQNYKEEFPQNLRDSSRMMASLASRMWNSKDILTLRSMFNISDKTVFPNMLAKEELLYQRMILEPLVCGDTTFPREVYKWLDKEMPDPGKELEEFYESYGGKELSEDDQGKLRALVVDLYQKTGHTEPQPRRLNELGVKALNNRLIQMELLYEIRGEGDIWFLNKKDANSADEEADHIGL